MLWSLSSSTPSSRRHMRCDPSDDNLISNTNTFVVVADDGLTCLLLHRYSHAANSCYVDVANRLTRIKGSLPVPRYRCAPVWNWGCVTRTYVSGWHTIKSVYMLSQCSWCKRCSAASICAFITVHSVPCTCVSQGGLPLHHVHTEDKSKPVIMEGTHVGKVRHAPCECMCSSAVHHAPCICSTIGTSPVMHVGACTSIHKFLASVPSIG